MNEIDANKYFKAFDGCESFIEDMVDELYENIVKQNKQLKAENEDLKKQIKSCKECAEQLGKYKVAEQYLDEIEEICKVNPINTCWTALNLCDKCKEKEECDLQSPLEKLDSISNIIKQAKEE